jgi:hypothetical protein
VDNSLVRAASRCQGLAFNHGKGRVVLLGEAGALCAQFDKAGLPFEMNVAGTDNRQLSLNITNYGQMTVCRAPKSCLTKFWQIASAILAPTRTDGSICRTKSAASVQMALNSSTGNLNSRATRMMQS